MTRRSKRYYKAKDICRIFDISKATLFRWERDGQISGVRRDWRNWRLYSLQNVKEIRLLIKKKNTKRGS